VQRDEEGALVARLAEQGKSQREIARRLRVSNGYVSYFQRLMGLPEDVRRAVDEELLSVRAGVRLGEEPDPARAQVLAAARETGPLSIGDVERLLAAPRATPPGRAVARRGSAWSREKSVHAGLVWKRQRGDELQFRFTLPKKPTQAERAALRAFLEAQLESL
jgi:transcriptional regulator with XRE-family HTH domain